MKTALLAAVAAAAAVALSCAPTASAGPARSDLPAGARIANEQELLSPQAAARNRARIRRTGRFPAAPRLTGVGRRRLAAASGHDDFHGRSATSGLEQQGAERMFGSETAYAAKRDPILGAIQRYNGANVPRNGGTYVAPRLYEVQHGQGLPGCDTAVYNGVYCPGVNAIGWSMTWTANAFATSGDMAWAMLLSHEYGHSAQRFLGISGGWMGVTLYSEAFADCMAGGFLYYAHANRLTDSVGRGDHAEFRDAVYMLRSATTEYSNHGTFEWRWNSAVYGWNVGFDGCVRWARGIDGV